MPSRQRPEPLLLAAPDKFKGSLDATDAAGAVAEGAAAAGWAADRCPLSDGGEGFAEVLSCLGGERRTTTVTGPLGRPVEAIWRLAGDTAVIESATASGLELAGGAAGNDPLEATSRGTGELIAAAVAAGARRVLVGAGGSAMTDGGAGALDAVDAAGGIGTAELVVACDVSARFVEAAERFGPQKGAGPAEVAVLRRRLEDLVARYRQRAGRDVSTLPGSGAAGGLGGGLAVLGARLVAGFDLVAEAVGLDERLARAALVVTGEGRLDASSWTGKVVSGVCTRAARRGVAVLLVVGTVAEGGAEGAPRFGASVTALDERFEARSSADPAACVTEAVRRFLDERAAPV
ncbi:MAG: glycerate kinase [Acidimicrobiales bacterium]